MDKVNVSDDIVARASKSDNEVAANSPDDRRPNITFCEEWRGRFTIREGLSTGRGGCVT